MVPPATDSAAFCRRHLAAIAGNGYHAFPIPPARKRTHWTGWTAWCRTEPRPDQIARWVDKHGHYGLALACGHAHFAIDIDEEDPGRAGDLHALAAALLGTTALVRIGRAPRRVLVYRVAGAPVASRRLAPAVELIGDGRYVLAHGIHPDLGQPYVWPEGAPQTVPLADLPAPDAAQLAAFAEAVAGFYDLPAPAPVAVRPPVAAAMPIGRPSKPAASRMRVARADPRWVLDAHGRVCDGREAYLAIQVYQAYREHGSDADAETIASAAWARFSASADLTRPRRDGGRAWRRADALGKAHALLRRQPDGQDRGARRRADGFWTDPVLAAFCHVVDARGAAGALSPATVAVSHAMTRLARTAGVCFASPATLATALGLAVRTVKQARAALVAEGLWRVENNRGGRARGADYRPDPAALGVDASTAEPVAISAAAEGANGARGAHPNLPVGGGSPVQDEARGGSSSNEKSSGEPLGSPCSRAVSAKCRTGRRPGDADRVGEVPHAVPALLERPGRGHP